MKLDVGSFYDDTERLKYNPEGSFKKRGFLKRLVAFDDRFVTVKKELEELIGQKSTILVKILDIGVGDGIYEAILDERIRKKCEIYGIDISEGQLKRAKRFLKEVKEVDLNTEKIPYPENSFDIVIASEILEHVFYPEKILQEAERVLKKEGYMLITIPNSACLQLRMAILLTGHSTLLNYPTNREHIRFFTSNDIKKMISSKLEVIKVLGLSSFLLDKWNFFIRIPIPRIIQITGNRFLPSLALGNMIIIKKK
ncbi:MAG: class I SAM-dependent methyltransferase [Candidatus Daviesbacteria bacterium]|nr:class I SAM-dependent methyltransferase [Candidatus Daviesbacteria bacterium]